MKYYEVALLNSSAPILTYSYFKEVKKGSIVEVPLKSKIKRGVVLKEVKEPTFKCEDIKKVVEYFFNKEQLEIANFIKEYYFSSFGEAIGLFVPYKNEMLELCNLEISNLPKLTKIQTKAYNEILKKDLSLLFGVTGSGKTEIYIHLISNILKDGKNAILLMPEIALTPQITKRLKRYFGNSVITWHSKLTKKKRQESIDKIYSGEARVIIGARSALFLPIDRLGLIIVDEEHDDSYKSHSTPRYNAKDLSIYIGKKYNIKVVLGSATPLVTSYKKYPIVRVKKPYKEARKEFIFTPGEEINLKILEHIKKVVSKGEQALVFVPTRANFKYLICSDCGKAQSCPFCSIGMSIHSKKRYLKCHYCSYIQKIPNRCQYCDSEALTTQRVGTAEVVDLIKDEIKEAKIEQFDKDTITTANKLHKALLRVQNKESNIIVGTQMLSKGHDYPEITLSVITGLDYITALGDYRAKERAIALLHQIAGRSGRAKDAVIIIQTSQPDFFKPYINDYEDFIKEELTFRESLYPPYKNLARVLIANRDYNRANLIMQEALEKLKNIKDIEIVGAGVAPIEKIANRWRFNILLRALDKIKLLKALYLVKNQNIQIDIDPVDFS